VVRSLDAWRALEKVTALSTLIRQRHLTPSCGGHAPTAERTVGPARMIAESLTSRPGIREQHPQQTSNTTSAFHSRAASQSLGKGCVRAFISSRRRQAAMRRRGLSLRLAKGSDTAGFDLLELNGPDLRRDPIELRKGEGCQHFAHAFGYGVRAFISSRRRQAAMRRRGLL
jgi:hypothetical protein